VTREYPDPFRRRLITLPAVLGAGLVAVDMTIANVALTHMQASVSASADQIIWVLTAYIIAAAIATPLSGWLAERFGRKLVMMVSMGGFTFASALCGWSNDLEMLVFARILQGACGAALIPLGQATLLDINPPEDFPKAIAVYSLGAMAGPLIGPSLGGWLTDTLSWRWVFFVNIPIGVLSLICMGLFFVENRRDNPPRFDMFGFLTVSVALAAFQLMLDRGEQLDWFESAEVQIYAAILAVSLYLGTVHILTTKESFVRPELFKDRNFAIGSFIGILLGVLIFSNLPLIVVMTQNLFGYTAEHTGLVGMPRALGTVVAMLIISKVINYVDKRIILCVGATMSAISMFLYSNMDLYVDERALLIAGLFQGIGGGMFIVPLTVLVFTTLPPNLRNEGASMHTLLRNIGNAAGISMLTREFIHYSAESRAHLVEGARPDNPIMQYARPDFDYGSAQAWIAMNNEVARHSAMVGYVEIFWVIGALSLAMLPFMLLLKNVVPKNDDAPLPVMD
jgi:DHA2 family multidrug resistance protein